MEIIEAKQPIQEVISPQSNGSAVSAEPPPAIGALSKLLTQAGQAAAEPCLTCGSAAGGAAALPPSYIYAIGEIDWRFPSESLEMEFKQVLSLTSTTGLNEYQAQKKFCKNF